LRFFLIEIADMPKKNIDPRFNYALSQVFSPSLLKRIDDPIHEENLRLLLQDSRLYATHEKWDFIRGLELTYNYLKHNYRCEYVYMNEIANQLLLKCHKDNSATLLKEVTSDCSIADIVIINAKTVAYEIKTELDSFDRLDGQIECYQSLYDNVNVVTHPGAVDWLSKNVSDGIGIIVLEKNGILSVSRRAADCSNLFDPSKAVLTLRQSELIDAYEKYVGNIPLMGTALIYNFCYEWFITLERNVSHKIFSEALKSRKPTKHQFDLITGCNPSLKMLFLGRSLSKKFCTSVISRMGIFA
jgi:hypothetical protein